MREVAATEAKSRLAELLRSVEHGESIAITRHGQRVAHLIPAEAQERAELKAAVDRFRRRRARWPRTEMSTEDILAARRDGHRV